MFSRRDTVLAVVLVLLVGGLWLVGRPGAGEPDPGDPRPSSFLATPSGTHGLYLALGELGVPTSRRLAAYDADAAPIGGALALLAPREPLTPRELGALHDRVRSGGMLLYAARPGDPTLDTLGLELRSLVPDTLGPLERPGWAGVPLRPRPHRWTRESAATGSVAHAFTDGSPALAVPGATPLLVTEDGGRAVVAFPRGEGTVVAWSDPALLSNRALREGGRPLVFARAAVEATSAGDSLVFDEYHHGYRAGGGPVRATARFVRETAPGRTALQLALAGAGLLLLLGRRFGAPLELRRGRRRSPLEHVDALSAAYRRAGARATVRRRLVAGLARRLGRRLPEGTSEAAFLERLAGQLPTGRDEVERLLAEWRRGEAADPEGLARAVDAVVGAVRGPRAAEENGNEVRHG